jgi:hypothetical protein
MVPMATTEGDPVYTVEAMLGVGHLPDLTVTADEFSHLLGMRKIRIVMVNGRGDVMEELGEFHSRVRAKAEQDEESRHSEPVGVSHAEG